MLNRTTVDYLWQMIEEGVEDQWACLRNLSYGNKYIWRSTHVFNQEYRPPAGLWTKILHRELSAIHDASAGQRSLIDQRLCVIFQRKLLPLDV